jgi:hypothetical protein
MMRRLALLLCVLAGCQNTAKKSPPQGSVTQAPPAVAGPARPVYVLPKFTKGYVNPGRDKEGKFHMGYETIVEVEPGHLALEEEAEQMGVAYIRASDVGAIPGTPKGAPQELNATTLAQILAARQNNPSDVSLRNQRPAVAPTPPLDEAGSPPKVSETPAILPGFSESGEPSSTPSVRDKATSQGLTGHPKITFSKGTGQLAIYPGGKDGDSFAIPTPIGPASLTYRDGKITISFRGKTVEAAQPSGTPLLVKLAKPD